MTYSMIFRIFRKWQQMFFVPFETVQKQGGNVPLLKTSLGKNVGSTVLPEYTNHKFWTPFLDDLFFASAAKIAICLGWKWKRPYNSPVLSFWPYVFSLQLCLVLWKVGLPDVIV